MTASAASSHEPQATDAEPLVAGLPAEDSATLARLLDEYLAEVETGMEPDVDRLLEGHSHLAVPLRRYLDSLHLLQRAASLTHEPATRAAGLPAGRMLGDYRLLREIGRGGMGVVYEAWQASLDRRVALKVLPFAAVLDPKYIARFQNEVRAAAHLQHPHIVPIYGVGCERGVHYYSMQFIDGQPLDQAIRELRSNSVPPTELVSVQAADSARETAPRSAATPWSAATIRRQSTFRSNTGRAHIRGSVELARQAAEGLQHAHEFGIVHRDVKPSNLLVDRRGHLWITDFGLARVQASADLTASGDILGTLRYMSPEQAAGQHALVDPRADVYSLGATLYELLTLRPAYPDADRHALLWQIEHQQPPSPRRINPSIPFDLETIVLKAMSKQRESRYASAQEFAQDLQRFLDGRPTLARRPSLIDRGAKWFSRHRHMALVTLAGLLLSVLASGAAAVIYAQKQHATDAALDRAEAHLATAKQVVDRFGAEMSDRLAGIPGTESVRSDMLDESLRFYEELSRYAESNPALKHDAAIAAFKAAGLAEKTGQLERAIGLYDLAAQRFASVIGSSDGATSNVRMCEQRRILLTAVQQNNLGRQLLQRGELEPAGRELTAARSTLENLLPGTGSAEVQSCLAGVLNNLALVAEQQQRLVEATSLSEQAVALQDAALQQSPDSEARRQTLKRYSTNHSRLHGLVRQDVSESLRGSAVSQELVP